MPSELYWPFFHAISAFPHVVGKGACLGMFGHVAHEAWVLVSTISRFQWTPPCAMFFEISSKPETASSAAYQMCMTSKGMLEAK